MSSSGSLVGKRLGKYELLALLAMGGTAEIYLARIGGEAGFEKYVVVKTLLDHLADEPEYVRMFLDEARLGAQLDHSNIVQTLELGEQDGRYFMAMEYLAGMSLAQLARRTQERVPGGYMPVDLVLGLAAQTCAGLNYAHRKVDAGGTQLNLVHRDISPQNLVVSYDGVLKIVDFGIAKADVRDTHTRSGTIKGKFAYMSPEQCLAKHVDNRTDIFALGVILHELLCARRLFKRQTTYETYEAIIQGKVPKPSEVNPALDPSLDPVVLRALAYNREDRYATAEEFGQTLLETLHRRGTSISASNVAAYYEQYFEAELDEHARRMRELITGQRRKVASDESLNWDAAELIEEIDPADIVEVRTGEEERDTADILEPDTVEPVADDAGATRIEMNPLEKAQAAHDNAGRAGAGRLPAHDTHDLSDEALETLDTASDASPVKPRGNNPNANTIGPGVLPSIFDQKEGGRTGRASRVTADLGPRRADGGDTGDSAASAASTASAGGKPKRTVLGMAPPAVQAALAEARRRDSSSPPPRPAGADKRTLFSADSGGAPTAAVAGETETPPPSESSSPKALFASQPGPPPTFGPRPAGNGQLAVPPDTIPPTGQVMAPGTGPQQAMARGYPPIDPGHTAIEPQRPPWLIGLVFVVSVGIGLGVTLLIAAL